MNNKAFQIIRRKIGNMLMNRPHCRRFKVADIALYEQYQDFLNRWDKALTLEERNALHSEAALLADKLYSQALDLGYSKVNELSEDIYWLTQCAAVISLLAFGRKSESYLKYEKSLLGRKKPYLYTQQQRSFVRYRNKFME